MTSVSVPFSYNKNCVTTITMSISNIYPRNLLSISIDQFIHIKSLDFRVIILGEYSGGAKIILGYITFSFGISSINNLELKSVHDRFRYTEINKRFLLIDNSFLFNILNLRDYSKTEEIIKENPEIDSELCKIFCYINSSFNRLKSKQYNDKDSSQVRILGISKEIALKVNQSVLKLFKDYDVESNKARFMEIDSVSKEILKLSYNNEFPTQFRMSLDIMAEIDYNFFKEFIINILLKQDDLLNFLPFMNTKIIVNDYRVLERILKTDDYRILIPVIPLLEPLNIIKYINSFNNTLSIAAIENRYGDAMPTELKIALKML
jgi:hypothetical protein